MEFWVDLVLRIGTVLSIFGTWVALFISKIRAKSKANLLNKAVSETAENKENQKEQEKELVNMAKTLCDKCGKEVSVRDVRPFEDLDLCPDCFKNLNDKQSEVIKLTEEMERLTSRLNEAKQHFFEIRRYRSKEDNSEQAQVEDVKEEKTEIDASSVVEKMFKGGQ